MSGHIVFENIPITNIIDDIDIKQSRDYNTSPYVGGTGSNSNFVSELGKVISFKNIVPYYEEIEDNGEVKENPPVTIYRNLSQEFKNKPGVLTSNSHLDLKGNYLCSEFSVVEDTGNNFLITWEFTEVVPFNAVKQTFRVWGSASSTTSKQQKTAKTSGSKLNSTSKTLLKSCGTLSPSTKVSKCVKYLQKFMQSLGYYKKYKVDGIYGSNTKAEVKKLQKANKLKQTGNWDINTTLYFQKKYKITSSVTQKVTKSVTKTAKKIINQLG